MNYMVKIASKKYNNITATFTRDGYRIDMNRAKNNINDMLKKNGLYVLSIEEISDEAYEKYPMPFMNAYMTVLDEVREEKKRRRKAFFKKLFRRKKEEDK